MAKRKGISALMSAAGWIGSFIGELIPALRERGISDEQIHAFANADGKISIGKIADVMAAGIKSAEAIHAVEFNYDEAVENKVVSGKYDWSNSDIASDHFPTRRTGVISSNIKLFHFNRYISSEDATREMDKAGYRPAEACELLDFGAKYPDVQREFPVIALGSVWQSPDGDRRVVCLSRCGVRRRAYLSWFGDGWVGACRFAAVRK